MKNKFNVSYKELEVLNVLWESDKPLTAMDIHESHPELALSTIQNCFKKMLKKNLIRVDEIIYSGKVLTRRFIPLVTKESFILDQYEDINLSRLVNEFIGGSSSEEVNEELDELEKLIRKKKRELK